MRASMSSPTSYLNVRRGANVVDRLAAMTSRWIEWLTKWEKTRILETNDERESAGLLKPRYLILAKGPRSVMFMLWSRWRNQLPYNFFICLINFYWYFYLLQVFFPRRGGFDLNIFPRGCVKSPTLSRVRGGWVHLTSALFSSYERLWLLQQKEIGRYYLVLGLLLLGLKFVKLEILSTSLLNFLYDKLGEIWSRSLDPKGSKPTLRIKQMTVNCSRHYPPYRLLDF